MAERAAVEVVVGVEIEIGVGAGDRVGAVGVGRAVEGGAVEGGGGDIVAVAVGVVEFLCWKVFRREDGYGAFGVGLGRGVV